MATITLKSVPEKLHAKLKSRARRSGRSLNREIIHALQEIVREDGEQSAEEWLKELDAVRKRHDVRLSLGEIQRFKVAGRK